MSVGAVLGIIQQGAQGASATQLQEALQLSGGESKNGFRDLTEKIKVSKK